MLLNQTKLDAVWVAKEANNEVLSDEGDAFTRVLELLAELGQVGDIQGWAILLGQAEESVVLTITQRRFHLKLEDLLLLGLVL